MPSRLEVMSATVSSLLDTLWRFNKVFMRAPWESEQVVADFEELWPQISAGQQWAAANADSNEKVLLLAEGFAICAGAGSLIDAYRPSVVEEWLDGVRRQDVGSHPRILTAHALTSLGVHLLLDGRYEAAWKCLKRALVGFKVFKQPYHQTATFLSLSEVAEKRGWHWTSKFYSWRARRGSTGVQLVKLQSKQHVSSARMAMNRGHFEKAERLYLSAKLLSKSVEDLTTVLTVSLELVRLDLRKGDRQRAFKTCDQILDSIQASTMTAVGPTAYTPLMNLLVKIGHPRARNFSMLVLSVARRTRLSILEGCAQSALGMLALKDDPEAALVSFDDAVRAFSEANEQVMKLDVEEMASQLRVELDNIAMENSVR